MRIATWLLTLLSLALLTAAHAWGQVEAGARRPLVGGLSSLATEPVAIDPDDPAIWVNPRDPARSLILGTDKGEGPGADEGEGLYVFDLSGHIVQRILRGTKGPNNVAVEYGFDVGGRKVDIAVTTERSDGCLRVFAISPWSRRLREISSPGGLRVFEGEEGQAGQPMGIDLYRRPSDGAVFAIVSRAAGPTSGYLWQYLLEPDGEGRVKATKVREFCDCTEDGEIEGVVVDDELGYVYAAEEGHAIYKWHADPDHPDANKRLAVFGEDGFGGEREGLAILPTGPGTGCVLRSDPLVDGSEIHGYRREGAPGDPHDHSELVANPLSGADDTDGLDAVGAPLGPEHPKGIIVVMNSRDRNFLILDTAEFLRWIGEDGRQR